MTADAAHLEVRGIGKSFGATRALDDVSVTVAGGSVHAFVGENGAGKSTLGKIIAGVFPQDQGDLVLRGTTVSFASPRQALVRGIALVAQEVALVPRLTVAENVFLGAEPRRAGFIDRRSLRERFDRLIVDAGFDLHAGTVVGRLPLAQQQQVEILRALAREADLIVLDEPSASLSAKEVDRLHEVVRGLRARGRTVVLVSHFLSEVLALSDVVTVLRDGRVIRTNPTSDETEGSLVTGMLGRPAGRAYPPKQLPPPDARVALSIDGLSAPGVEDATLTLRAGEIVGLAGLVGAGRSELARAIFGASPATAGERPGRGPRASGTTSRLHRGGRRDDPGVAQGRWADPSAAGPGERQPDEPATIPADGFHATQGRGQASPGCPGACRWIAPARGSGGVAVRRQPAEAPLRQGDPDRTLGPHRGRADPRHRCRGKTRHLRGAGPPGSRWDGDPADLERSRGDPGTRPSRRSSCGRDDSSPSWKVRR